MDDRTFLTGVVAGLVAAGVFGFLLYSIREAMTAMNAPFKNQVIIQQTTKTPWNVFQGCFGGIGSCFIFSILLVGAIFAVVFGLYSLYAG